MRRLRSWTFSLFTAPVAPLPRLHSSFSAFAQPRRPIMIEVPSEVLNILFMALIALSEH